MCPQFLSHFQKQWEKSSVEKGNKIRKIKFTIKQKNSSHNNTAERVEAY
jgi:plasmid replication initiation protein